MKSNGNFWLNWFSLFNLLSSSKEVWWLCIATWCRTCQNIFEKSPDLTSGAFYFNILLKFYMVLVIRSPLNSSTSLKLLFEIYLDEKFHFDQICCNWNISFLCMYCLNIFRMRDPYQNLLEIVTNDKVT